MKLRKVLSVVLAAVFAVSLFAGCSLVGVIGSKFEQTGSGGGTITVTQLTDSAGFAYFNNVTLRIGFKSYVYSGLAVITIDGTTFSVYIPYVSGKSPVEGETFVGRINSAFTRITLCSRIYKLAD